ncbi:MAG TPA: hypothetical protein VNN08_17490, partial [Thermoanaerobaculia bacterium]|nr:hypothetical protein [Thermoanaerobaculia bacterium]
MFYDKLRDEIIESQRTQHDLMKWKLFLIAAIGAAGLGAFPGMMAVTARTPTDAALKPDTTPLLALIPLVCLYVDTLCFHNVLRVMAIARYCRSLTAKNPPVIGTDNLSRNEAAAIATYENYCKNNRRNFALEGFALVTTSVILSGLVIGFGLWPQFRARLGFASLKDSVLLLVVGISGLLFSLLFFTLFKGKVYWLDHS